LTFTVDVQGEFSFVFFTFAALLVDIEGRSLIVLLRSKIVEFGVTSTVELVAGGAQIPVTKENRLNYIDLVSSFKLNTQIKRQTEAFFGEYSVPFFFGSRSSVGSR